VLRAAVGVAHQYRVVDQLHASIGHHHQYRYQHMRHIPSIDRRSTRETTMATLYPIRVAAVGDLHATAGAAGRFRPGLQRAARESDLLLLAGDLTHMGRLDEARCLAAEVCDLGRTVAVLGNHDYQDRNERTITRILTGAGIHVLEGTAVVLPVRGVRVGVAGVKGFGGGFPGGLVHEFGEPEQKAFAAAGRLASEALATALARLEADLRIVLTHYAPSPDTLTGEPRDLYPVLGFHQLGQVIDQDGGVALAVHGHAHHGREHGTTLAGTPVRNVAQHVLGAPYRVYTLSRHPTGWRLDHEPADEEPRHHRGH
jgi:Icc-related predicted phosphoesterase